MAQCHNRAHICWEVSIICGTRCSSRRRANLNVCLLLRRRLCRLHCCHRCSNPGCSASPNDESLIDLPSIRAMSPTEVRYSRLVPLLWTVDCSWRVSDRSHSRQQAARMELDGLDLAATDREHLSRHNSVRDSVSAGYSGMCLCQRVSLRTKLVWIDCFMGACAQEE